jgi:hypothetical protein
MTCDADLLANTLLVSLTTGIDFNIPTDDISGADYQLPVTPVGGTVTPIDLAQLTTAVVGGTGSVDVLMSSMKAHLLEEYEAGRITGSEYSKVYLGLTQQVLQNATQFTLGKDQAYWSAIVAQQQAIAAQVSVVTARVQLNVAKAQLAQIRAEANTAKANYALTKMKLSTESAQFCAANFTAEEMLPKQLELLNTQVEEHHAQTSNTKTDGVTPVNGTIGAQRNLYDQQVISYARKSQIDAAQLQLGGFAVALTSNDSLAIPTQYSAGNIDEVITIVRATNDLGA